jgi:hypothetical protein
MLHAQIILLFDILIPFYHLFVNLPTIQKWNYRMMRFIYTPRIWRIHKRKSKLKTRYKYSRRKHRVSILKKLSKQLTFICAMSTTIKATWSKFRPPKHDHSYDTDSFLIGIDNHASYCMTNSLDDFISEPTLSKKKVRGISGYLTAVKVGTVRWKIEDDNGEEHKLILNNTYYIPSLPLRLLSPQHLAQTFAPFESMEEGTYERTTGRRVILTWMDKTYSRSIPLNRQNVGVFRSAPDNRRYESMEKLYKSNSRDPCIFQSTIIPPDDDDDDDDPFIETFENSAPTTHNNSHRGATHNDSHRGTTNTLRSPPTCHRSRPVGTTSAVLCASR